MKLTSKRRLFYGIYALQIVGILYAWWQVSSPRISAGGGVAFIAVGALFGLIAGFLFLYQLIMISGTQLIERYFGLDRLARIHHTTGLLGYGFLVAHVLFIVFGYSELNNTGFINQFFDIKNNFAYMMLAVISLILLDIVIVTSVFIVRKRLKYELWYFVHLLVYASVFLALFHQVTNGQNLLSNDALRIYWYALYITAFSLVLWRRWFLPVYLEFKHRFRVQEVVDEGGGVTSVYVTGKNLAQFSYTAGQFNLWQFWQKGLRTMHHPFTISSAPGDPYLRLSAKAIGDFTAKLGQLKKGSPVLVSGPYGLFTQVVATKNKRLFIAGGIGITPILSMLKNNVLKDDVLIYAAQTKEDAVFLSELKPLEVKGLKIAYVFSKQKTKGAYEGRISKDILKNEVSNIKNRDTWLCGPPPMMNPVEGLLEELSVPKNQVHTEKFRL